MKLTNKLDLPQAIVDAVRNDGYSRGDADVSVTGLLKPPRLSVLEAQHWDQLEEDASDRIWSLMGQTIHGILERANTEGVSERRLSMQVEGWTVSGAMDLFRDGVLEDYKVTSVWKVMKGDLEEWTKQLNLYSVLLRHHGEKVRALRIHAILRDWSKMEAERDPMYPQAQIVTINIPLWPEEIAAKFMRERVILHQQARVSLPQCSSEDRWQRPNVWAVMKAGNKRAVKLYDTEDAARAHVGFDKQLSVVLRPGESVRCKSYCPVAKFCSQYQASVAQADRPAAETDDQKQAI